MTPGLSMVLLVMVLVRLAPVLLVPELTRLVTKQRTGNYGPKYTTAGRA